MAQCRGGMCYVTQNALLIPGAWRERVPFSDIGAVHHEHDYRIVIDAVSYFFALDCHSREARDNFAALIAHLADCNLFDDGGLVGPKEWKKKLRELERYAHRLG